MKNQAVITTLAILLAMALSAIVALVVSSEVIGTNHAVADAPAPVVVQAEAAVSPVQAEAQQPLPQGDQDPVPAEPAAPAADAPLEHEEPVDPEEPEAPAPGAPVDPEAPAEPAPADPCDGLIVGDECVPASCPIGYELLKGDCLYVGCPLGFVLENGVCEKLQITLPCPDGLVRQDDGSCKPKFVFDPPVGQPLACIEGLKLVDGDCLPICPKGLKWTNGFCLPDGIGPVAPELDFTTGD